jgi:hypothetical protein
MEQNSQKAINGPKIIRDIKIVYHDDLSQIARVK